MASVTSARARRSRQPARTYAISFSGMLLYLGIVLLLLVLLWSTQRERESHVRVPDLARFEEALPSIAGLTGSPILAGNSADLLQNGDEFFPSILRDIGAARESVHLETYVWWKGDICREVAEALAVKARQGVEVRILLDAMGSGKMDNDLFDLMKDAGCKIERYHPFRLQDLGLANNRTHRKLLIVDGRVGYVFGHGIAREWTGRGQDEEHWRDTGVRLTGPIVGSVQSTFAENWVEQTTETLAGEKYFPPLPATGNVRAQMIAGSPQGGVSKLELLLKLAIATAQRELIVQNPYFIPDGELVGLIDRAVERGVKVQIMVPGPVTDSSIVRHAGHRQFQDLLDKGVVIYEHQKTLTHQKIMVVDGVWSFVGSTNFDDRSLDINDEASVGMIDPAVAAELEAAFRKDIESCLRLDSKTWSERPAWHRLVDRLSYAVNEQL